MAGDWIKMRTALWTCPQVVRIASALQRRRAHIVGALHGVWSLFDAHSTDGTLSNMPPLTLDNLTETEGLEAAMIAVGWLETEEAEDATSYTLPRYEEHNGPTAKRRAKEQKRKKSVRIASASNADQRRGEERREEKSKGETPSPPFDPADEYRIPVRLRTEEFQAAWQEWIQHRIEIRKKLTPTSVRNQLKRLSKMGEARAIAAIQHTIEKGWIGLQEPDRPAGEKPAFTSRGLNLGDRTNV